MKLFHSTPSYLILLLIALTTLGCNKSTRSNQMISYMNQDSKISSNLQLKDNQQYTYRKELLLPTKAGRSIKKNEDFIEVWLNNSRVGWVYFKFEPKTIQRIGYQLFDQSYIHSIYKIINLSELKPAKSTKSLMDGKEFK